MICSFFGHRDTPQSVKPELKEVLLDLIDNQGVTRFYVGNQGSFDAMVLRLLEELSITRTIRYEVVLAYLPKVTDPFYEAYYTVFPEGLETVPPRYAISYRNRWLVEHCDIFITFVRFSTGGAAQFKELALKKNKIVIELSDRTK